MTKEQAYVLLHTALVHCEGLEKEMDINVVSLQKKLEQKGLVPPDDCGEYYDLLRQALDAIAKDEC